MTRRRITGWRAETLRWAALAIQVVLIVVLVPVIGMWAVAVTAACGLSWLLVFTLGLPAALTETDLSKVLPPDTHERLNRN